MSRTSLALALVIAALPAIAGAQQDSTRRDSTRHRAAGQYQKGQRDADDQRRTTEKRGGEVGPSRFRGRTYGLNQDQVRQLQQALNDNTQCDAGEADGKVGPRTRRAIACARKELNVRGSDMGELFRALDLDFANDEGGQDDQGVSGRRARDDDANRGNRGNRGNAGRDSTMRDSSRGQRPPGQQPPR